MSSNISLVVVGNGANENAISLCLITDRANHLFNCGEGTQRLIHEHKFVILVD